MLESMTRRGLMRTGLAAVAGAVAAGAVKGPLPAWAAEAVADPAKPRMHLGTVTYMIGEKMDLPTLIDVCEKSGLEGVELRTTHAHGVEPSLDAEGRAKVKERFSKTRVRLVVLGTVAEFHSPDPATVKKNIAQANEFTKLAVDVGAWGIKVRPNGLPKDVPTETTLRQIGEALREVGEFAKDKGITVCVECHGGGTSDPPNMAKIMEFCKHPSVGLCWNSNAIDVKDGSIKENFELCKAWIKHCHIQPLDGKYPNAELMPLLKSINFTGYTMLETSTKEDPVVFLRRQRELWEKLAL